MRTLEIVFTKSKKCLPIFSWLICWYTKKTYSHVARKLQLYNEIDMFYQASEGKVNYEFQDVFDKKHEIMKSYKIEVPEEIYKEIGKECLRNAGKKYATAQNLGIVIVDLFKKLFNKDIENPWKDGRNCSELIYSAAIKKMIGALPEYHENTIKPHEIEAIILKYFTKGPKDLWIKL